MTKKIAMLLPLLVLFLFCASVFAAETPVVWKMVNLPGSNSDMNFNLLQFPDASVGYVGGINGVIFKTSDGGKTWTQLYTKTKENIEGFSFLDANTGFVAIAQGFDVKAVQEIPSVLKKTTDGGTSFADVASGGGVKKKIQMLDANNGYAFTAVKDPSDPNNLPIKLSKTTNGGASWSVIKEPSSKYKENELADFYAVDANTCYLVTDLGEVFKTSDAGASWATTKLTIPTPTEDKQVKLQGVKFFDASSGVVVGRDMAVFLTTDSGATWKNISPKETVGNGSIMTAAGDINNIIVAGSTYGCILRSKDQGATWSKEKSEKDLGSFFGLVRTSAGHEFAVANYGNGLLVTKVSAAAGAAAAVKKAPAKAAKKSS